MNHNSLEAIDYLREKANISYEEAMHLLNENGNDVLRVMVELEKQGRLYDQDPPKQRADDYYWDHYNQNDAPQEGKLAKAWRDFSRTRVSINKKNAEGETETVTQISGPLAAGIALAAPQLTVIAGALGLASGYSVNLQKEGDEKSKNEDN